jgi:ABC-type phosphate transport system auxiliary subunit
MTDELLKRLLATSVGEARQLHSRLDEEAAARINAEQQLTALQAKHTKLQEQHTKLQEQHMDQHKVGCCVVGLCVLLLVATFLL